MARRPTPQMVADGARCAAIPARRVRRRGEPVSGAALREFAAEFARQGVTYIVPSAIDNHVNKLVRIRRLGPYLSRGGCGSCRARHRRGCSSISCAISPPATTTTAPTPWKWRSAWQKTSCTAATPATDWAIGYRWDE